VATGPSPRYHGALEFGSLRSQHHIKLPDKLKFIALLHLSTVIFNSAVQKIRTATGNGGCSYIKIAFKRG
jgi:hypothetical protein